MPRVTSAFAGHNTPSGKRRIQFAVPVPLHEYLTRFSLETGVPRARLFRAYIDYLLESGHILGLEEWPEGTISAKPHKVLSLLLTPEKERTFRKFLVEHEFNMTELFCRYILWLSQGNPPVGIPGAPGFKEDIEICINK